MLPKLLPDDARRIDHQLALLAKVREALPQVATPYLGHLRIEVGGENRDILLGAGSFLSHGISLINWQTAPLAEVFFTCTEGEHYELEIGERTVFGKVVERNLVQIEQGELIQLQTPQATFTRDGSGSFSWRAEPARELLMTWPAQDRSRRATLPKLDPAQQRLVDLPAGNKTLILGEAGFGKTTVALHRLAALQARAGPGFRAAVIVPTDGLRRLTELQLSRLAESRATNGSRRAGGDADQLLGASQVEAWTYDRWAAAQARRAFPGLPSRESTEATAATVRLKRHPALRELLPLVSRIGRGRMRRSHLEHLFGDRALLEQIARQDPSITPGAIDEVLAHTHVQFSKTSEREHQHVDADRLLALDGRTLDSGTPQDDADTIDAEDYAVLFALDKLRSGMRPPLQYDCIVLDEAQELAPLELELVARSLAPQGTLIVAGDAGQQVDPAAHFLGWDETLRELDARNYQTVTLEVSYRCPPDVTELARHLLEPALRAPPRQHQIAQALLPTELHKAAWLIDELRALSERDPGASVAVICRSVDAAVHLERSLSRGLEVRLALEGRFLFRPGVEVTCVPEVKGLEFDIVIAPDLGPQPYPDDARARRALYVAVTRATEHLALASTRAFSPLLKAFSAPPALLP